jgi:hypothetical protein
LDLGVGDSKGKKILGFGKFLQEKKKKNWQKKFLANFYRQPNAYTYQKCLDLLLSEMVVTIGSLQLNFSSFTGRTCPQKQ